MTTLHQTLSRSLIYKLCVTSALSTATLATTSAIAGEMYIYKDPNGQVLLTNVNPSGNFEKFTKKVKVTYYPDSQVLSGSNTSNPSYGTNNLASSNSKHNAYDALIIASATRHNVDPALMKAMMHTESAFNPNARSPVGAQGLMQLMPATARRFSVSNAWNPAENIEGSAKYIAWLTKRFNGNMEHVVAGYNAGEGNVDKYGGIPPFKETRNYVKKVMQRYHTLYKNDSGLRGAAISPSNTYGQAVSYSTNSNGMSVSYANSAYNALR